MLNYSANGPSGYNLTNSLRFRSSASAYLNRTPASAGNRKTWTYSVWVKRGTLGVVQEILGSNGSTDATNFAIEFNSSDQLYIGVYSNVVLLSTQVFRDPSAWYHIVIALDTTQATASNRCKVYINNVQITSWATDSSATYFTLNSDQGINNNTIHNIGRNPVLAARYFDGYTTEMNLIDGQALTPSSFGSTNSTTGVWQPAKYTGTYGNNGFYLNFNSIALTSGSNTGLGKDNSGNGNYWNTNNISVTAGTTYDAMTDVPTLTSATVANYCVMNAAAPYGAFLTLSQANLRITCNGAYWAASPATFGVSSGKWYWEVHITNLAGNSMLGITRDTDTGATTGQNVYPGISANSYGYIAGGLKYNNATGTSYGATYTTNDIIGIALDMDAGTLTYYKNNTSQGTAFSGLSGTYLPSIGVNDTNTAVSVNFGQRPFTYTPPTGFLALNTYNLPTSTIVQGNKYMDATTYTGTGSTQSITNTAGFQPDFVWMKGRSGATDHALYDVIRGVTLDQASNTQAAQTTQTTGLTTFNSNGFSIGALAKINTSAATYVGWQWKANGTGVSNTSGSITSTVSANTTDGFSTVGFTIPAAGGGTIGHGLGVAPKMVTIKIYNQVENYRTYHASLGAGGAVYWNLTDAFNTTDNIWNSVAPTSSVFNIKTGYFPSGWIGVAYCWAEIAGFSKFGSYTGNGSTDGPFVYTGFRPKFIMIKRSDASDNWYIFDSARSGYNYANDSLSPNLSNAEYSGATYQFIDLLSNGFKLRDTYAGRNASGGTYIFMAFAENPFKNSLAR